MPKQYRSAQGKTVDMAALAAKNEKVRAVGNMNVNARGDTIDSFGRVIVPATQKVGDSYNKTVGNKSANPVKSGPVNNTKRPAAQPKPQPQLTKDELELEDSFGDDLEVEAIKAKETKK